MEVFACFGNSLLALAILASVFARSGNADSLMLISESGGQYDYGIQLDANHGIVFAPGNLISLTGLAGVTGGALAGPRSLICESRHHANLLPP